MGRYSNQLAALVEHDERLEEYEFESGNDMGEHWLHLTWPYVINGDGSIHESTVRECLAKMSEIEFDTQRPRWREIKLPSPSGCELTFKTVDVNGKTFGAASCWVSIGGADIPAMAVIAGEEKHINGGHICIDWLSDRGMPREFAQAMVDAADDLKGVAK